ncbi:MAG: NAD-dependent DNA ligase LigA, partial [Coriobacteriia bacterium]
MPLPRQQAEQRILQLREEIEHHSYRYYALDAPEISDGAYDSLLQELQGLEDAFPDLITTDSPTRRVGAPPSEQFAQIQHASRLYSLDNAMDIDELDTWLARVRDVLGDRPCSYVCELKIDGSSLALTY